MVLKYLISKKNVFFIESDYENINKEVIHVNEKLAEGDKGLHIEKIIGERKSNGTKYVRNKYAFF